jgi:GT2 family glycosyltransferase
MLEYALRPDVGAVGAKLYYPNQLIQHAGVIVGMGAGASHYFVGCSRNHTGYNYNLVVPQNLSAVTAACLMMRRKVFDEIGGFSPEFQIAYGDVDLCLRIRQFDYLVVWTPFAELIHNESMTRGYEDTPEKEAHFIHEANLLKTKWADFFVTGDPYYNPNLTLSRGDFSIRSGHGNQAPRLARGLLSSTHLYKERG